ncbi:MAG: hypothetical protein FJ312_11195 [SAR202 cluster bacterium]|nr:hypothetical protein [SAR202 cluster bacterium]
MPRGIWVAIGAAVADPTGLPLSRVQIELDTQQAGQDAAQLAKALREGAPSVWTLDQQAARGVLQLELVALRDDEIGALVDALARAVSRHPRQRPVPARFPGM